MSQIRNPATVRPQIPTKIAKYQTSYTEWGTAALRVFILQRGTTDIYKDQVYSSQDVGHPKQIPSLILEAVLFLVVISVRNNTGYHKIRCDACMPACHMKLSAWGSRTYNSRSRKFRWAKSQYIALVMVWWTATQMLSTPVPKPKVDERRAEKESVRKMNCCVLLQPFIFIVCSFSARLL